MANQAIIKETTVNIGDLVKIHQVFRDEKDKEKTQIFEGRVIAIKNRAPNTTFTVRKIGAGRIGIERIFPVLSPAIGKIEVVKKFPARRAKLHFLRDQLSR